MIIAKENLRNFLRWHETLPIKDRCFYTSHYKFSNRWISFTFSSKPFIHKR